MEVNLDLQFAIKRKFRNQYEFALAVGWHESDVSRVIYGRRNPDEAERKQWAKVLGVKPEEIFGRGTIDTR